MRGLHLKPITLAITVAFSVSGTTAHAIGLGTPGNTPIIGQPLRLDIPVTVAPGETLPTSDCIRIAPPGDAPDRQFFPRNARVVVEGGNRPRIRIVSSDAVVEPLVEFRLTVGCGNSFSRDFLVLSDVPAAIPTQITANESRPSSAEPRTAAEPPAAKFSEPRIDTHPEANTLRLSRDSNLNTLARSRYPANQATRDEYRRLMAAANPELFAGASRLGSVPLPAGTILKIPVNLPPPENSAPEPAPEPITKTPRATPSAPKPSVEPSATPVSVRTPPKDRLIIGGNSASDMAGPKPLTPREMASAMDRLERMLEDQGRTEHQMITNLETLNSAFIEVKNYVQSLEKQMRQVENTQRALESKVDSRPEPKSLGILELLALILASGATGAGLSGLNHQLQLKRQSTDRLMEGMTEDARPAPLRMEKQSTPEPASTAPFASTPTASVTTTPVANNIASVSEPAAISPKPAVQRNPKAVPPEPKTPGISLEKSIADGPASATGHVKATSDSLPAVPPTSTYAPPASPEPAPSATAFELDTSGLDPVPPPDPALEIPLEFVLPELELPAAAPLSAKPSAPTDKAEHVASLNISLGIAPAPSERKGDDAVELAEIMASMGLGKEAARTLVEHILEDPKRDLAPWLKALAIYRKTGQREEFEWLADQLRLHLNVKPDEWETSDDEYRSLIEFRHLAKRLITLWPAPECDEYLESLLVDNREGVRQGFPQSVAEEIILLQRILRELRVTA